MTKDEHRSTVRVLSILLALSNNPDGLTLAELSQQLAAPKAVCSLLYILWLTKILLLTMR